MQGGDQGDLAIALRPQPHQNIEFVAMGVHKVVAVVMGPSDNFAGLFRVEPRLHAPTDNR
ncbi:MAG: hypothetical protein CL581_15985 [Alteromonadaceae bacterium]|nr:hypothetical protein [Alteromonadaceae bacterium]MBH87330.1 hypothetical protein [Alteromonadaceae bacterium]